MLKILNIEEQGPAVFIIQSRVFEKTIVLSFEYNGLTLRALICERLNANLPPSEQTWFSLSLNKIEDKESLPIGLQQEIKSEITIYLNSIVEEYNYAIEQSYLVVRLNKFNFMSYLNEEKDYYEPVENNHFEKILADNKKKSFFDYTLMSKLEVLTEKDEKHITEDILEKKRDIEQELKNIRQSLSEVVILEANFQKAVRLYRQQIEEKNDLSSKKRVPISYHSSWLFGNVKDITKKTVIQQNTQGNLILEESWQFFEKSLFFSSNYKNEELLDTLKIKRLIENIEDILALKEMSDSFLIDELNKDLFELNYREIIETDYSKPHYLIRSKKDLEQFVVIGYYGALLIDFENSYEELLNMREKE